MTARSDREGPIGPPELPGVLHLEAGVAQALLGFGMVGGHDSGMPEHGRCVPIGEDQVDLGAVVLKPPDPVAEHLRCGDLLEPDQPPELNGPVGLVRWDLERDVMQHAPKTKRRYSVREAEA
jgi:hypothetical protein